MHHRVTDPDRFRVARTTRLWTVTAIIGVVLVAILLVSPGPPEIPVLLLGSVWVSLMLALTLPSRARRAGEELTARLGRFRHAVNAVGDRPTRAQLEDVLRLAGELNLREEEIAEDLARVRASMAALALLDDISGGRLPIVTTASALMPGDVCHFVEPVRQGRRRSDRYGQILLTTHWLKFAGTSDLSIAWTQVTDVERAEDDLVITTADRRSMRFAFTTSEDAARAGVIAAHLRDLAQADALADERLLAGPSDGYGVSRLPSAATF